MTIYCRLNVPGYASPDAEPHYRPDMLVYPTHIKFDFEFDLDKETIHGIVTQHLMFVEDVDEIEFNGTDLIIDSITDYEENQLEYNNTGEIITVNYSGKKGEEVIITFNYRVIKPKAGFYFVQPDDDYPDISQQVWSQFQDEDGHFVAPIMDNPAYKHTSEVIGRIPEEWNSLSNGELISKKIENGTKIVHWKFDVKHSTYLVTFAAGNLIEHTEAVTINGSDIEIRWYAPKGKEKEAKNAYERTGDILKFFSEYTRFPYPYDSYSQWSASRFIFGGMENTTATTQTELTLRDDRANLDSTSDNLVAHEAAHQWFGDWITCKSWGHAWLHESFATYFDALYTEYNRGRDEFVYQMRSNKLSYISEDSDHYRRPLVTNLYEEPIDLFDRHLYPGGSWRVHMLRNILGDDQFRDVLSYYLERHGQDLVETVDLSRAIEDVTGRNLDWFFDQWVHKAGYPKLKLSHEWDKKNKISKLTIKQTQKDRDDDFSVDTFRISTEISFWIDSKEQRFSVDITDKEHTYYFSLQSKPEMVRFDPDYTILCKVDFKKSQEMLLHQLENDEEVIGQILAIKKLKEKPNYTKINAIGNKLLDDNTFWGVAKEAAKTLAEIKGEQAKEFLIEGLDASHPKTRRAVVSALAKFVNDSEIAETLKKKIEEGDKSYFVEGKLLSTIGKIKANSAFDLIMEYKDRPTFNDYSQRQAIHGLVALDKDKCLNKVIDMAQYGQPELARNTAIEAIGKLGRHRPEFHDQCLEELTKAAEDNLFRARLASISGFQELKHPKGIPVLRKLMEFEVDGRIKKSARRAIEKINEAIKKPKEIKKIHDDLSKLEKENKDLRSRIDKLEKLIDQDNE